MRVAAIDIGSNSIHLMVAEGSPVEGDPGAYRVLDDEKITNRLARGMAPDGTLPDEKIREAAEAVSRLASIARGYNVDRIGVIATAAVRSAPNGGDLVRLVFANDGLEVEVIDAMREAQLAFRSVDRAFDLEGQRVAVCDVGGGSTEVILATDGLIESVACMPIGAVKLTDRFGPCDDPEGKQHADLRAFVRDTVRDHLEKPEPAPHLLIGVGGTYSALGAMSIARRQGTTGRETDHPFGGHELMHEEVRHLLDWLRRLPIPERALTPGLNPDRADIIIAGIEIVDRIMRRLGINRIRVHDKGVRDGLVLEMLEGERRPRRRRKHSRVESARRFAEKCHYEQGHATRVAQLSLALFDAMSKASPGPWSEDPAREILESAALLHNVGYLISYQKHHKHSYHLIVHSAMPGFTRREIELVALIARYHRRAKPSEKHEPFNALDERGRDLVCKLAGILRVADGLNRTHRQTVAAIEVDAEPPEASEGLHTPGAVVIRVFGDDDGLGVWGAERKKRLFERAFNATLTFRPEPDTVPIRTAPPPIGGSPDNQTQDTKDAV